MARVVVPAAPVDEAAAIVEPDAGFEAIDVEAKPRLDLWSGLASEIAILKPVDLAR